MKKSMCTVYGAFGQRWRHLLEPSLGRRLATADSAVPAHGQAARKLS
ncbi:MAG: hypothetical protein JST43_03605 [Bacteroidetes bacterium]|nr:hypothetical protein [Bacteroidota bacterium]MBS1540187.1 hypothetical protein [Bacteroidota bacterium]